MPWSFWVLVFWDLPNRHSHIELARPVYHVNLISKVIQVLRCVCFQCYKLRVPRDHTIMKELFKLYKDRPQLLLQHCSNACAKVKRCGDRQTEADPPPADPLAPPGEAKAPSGCGSACPNVRRNPESGHYLELMEINPEATDQKVSNIFEVFIFFLSRTLSNNVTHMQYFLR
jgi:DNA-directed RNA polymerase beta' subunit